MIFQPQQKIRRSNAQSCSKNEGRGVYCKTIDQYSLQICPAAALINRISDQCRVCQKYTIYNITGTVLSSRPLKTVNN